MKILSSGGLNGFQNRFFKKHKIERVETSPFQNEQYHKTYYGIDGAIMVEINRAIYEQVEIEVKGVKTKVYVKLLETECYNTDEPISVCHYEQW